MKLMRFFCCCCYFYPIWENVLQADVWSWLSGLNCSRNSSSYNSGFIKVCSFWIYSTCKGGVCAFIGQKCSTYTLGNSEVSYNLFHHIKKEITNCVRSNTSLCDPGLVMFWENLEGNLYKIPNTENGGGY